MTNFNDFLQQQLQDSEFRREWEALQPQRAMAQALMEARRHAGLTQKQLAEKTGIAQSDISKLEGGSANPSLHTLQRLAAGMDMRLKIEFLPNQ